MNPSYLPAPKPNHLGYKIQGNLGEGKNDPTLPSPDTRGEAINRHRINPTATLKKPAGRVSS